MELFRRRSCATLVKRMLILISSESLMTAVAATEQPKNQADFRVLIVKLISMLLGSDVNFPRFFSSGFPILPLKCFNSNSLLFRYSQEEEAVTIGLDIADQLVTKCRDAFLDNLFRAGVVGQIADKAATGPSEEKVRTPSSTAKTILESSDATLKVNANDVNIQKFGEWNVMKTLDSTCLWTDYIIMELPNGSTWFQACMNGQVTVYRGRDSSGHRSSESDGEDIIFRSNGRNTVICWWLFVWLIDWLYLIVGQSIDWSGNRLIDW